MKKLILFFLLPQLHIHAMENQTFQKKLWNIKKIIQYNIPTKSATYNEPSNQLFIRDEKNITLINIEDREQSVTLPHSSNLWKPSFDPSGNYIITSPNQETITLSNTHGKEIMTIKNSSRNKPHIVKFDRTGNQILIADKNNIQLKNLYKKLTANYILKPEYSIKIAKFFPNDDNLIFIAPEYSSQNSKCKLWDVRNKNLITHDYIKPLKQVSIHKKGNYLAGIPGNEDGVIAISYVYDLRKKGSIKLTHPNKPQSVKFNSQGTRILTTYDYLALLWNTQRVVQCINKQQEYADFTQKLNPDNLSSATFHPNGNSILTCSTKNIINSENNFTMYDFVGNQLAKIQTERKIYSAKFDPTGNYIISKHEGNIITLWEK